MSSARPRARRALRSDLLADVGPMNWSRIIDIVAADPGAPGPRPAWTSSSPVRITMVALPGLPGRPPGNVRPRPDPAVLIEVHVLLGGVLEQPPAGELDPEVEAPHDQSGSASSSAPRSRRDHQRSSANRFGPEVLSHPWPAARHRQAHQPGRGTAAIDRVQQLEQDPGDHQGGEHRHQHPDGEGDPGTPDRPEARKKRRTAARRVVTLESRIALSARCEPPGERPTQPPGPGTLLCPLVDQHVGVHGHADGDMMSGDAGKGEGASHTRTA